jgi:hypothetical protein
MTDKRRVCGLCDATVGPGWNFCEKHLRGPAVDYQQTARDIIERMKTARPTCEKCLYLADKFAVGAATFAIQEESSSDAHFPGRAEVESFMRGRGYEPQDTRPAYVKRCDTCANARSFPWADKLDVARVAHMLEHDARCQSSFELSILEETLQPYTIDPKLPWRFPVITFGEIVRGDEPPAYQQAIDRKLETLAKNNLDLYGVQLVRTCESQFAKQLPAADGGHFKFPIVPGIDGQPPGKIMLGSQSDDGCATTCMDCGADVPDIGPLQTRFYCDGCLKRRHAERSAELEVMLLKPYHRATITGICKLDHEHNTIDCKYERAEPTAKKPAYRFPICCRNFERECGQGCICHTPENKSCPVVGCPIPYCDGAHAMSGPSTDKPRKGFEFL